jgi:hypothetical protein
LTYYYELDISGSKPFGDIGITWADRNISSKIKISKKIMIFRIKNFKVYWGRCKG